MEADDVALGEVVPVEAVLDRVEGLVKLAVGDPQVTYELAGQIAPESLRDIPRRRRSRSAQLTTEIQVPGGGPSLQQRVDLDLQLIRKLPGDQLRVRTGHVRPDEQRPCRGRGTNQLVKIPLNATRRRLPAPGVMAISA